MGVWNLKLFVRICVGVIWVLVNSSVCLSLLRFSLMVKEGMGNNVGCCNVFFNVWVSFELVIGLGVMRLYGLLLG